MMAPAACDHAIVRDGLVSLLTAHDFDVAARLGADRIDSGGLGRLATPAAVGQPQLTPAELVRHAIPHGLVVD